MLISPEHRIINIIDARIMILWVYETIYFKSPATQFVSKSRIWNFFRVFQIIIQSGSESVTTSHHTLQTGFTEKMEQNFCLRNIQPNVKVIKQSQ